MKAYFLPLPTFEFTGSVVRYSWIFKGVADQTEGFIPIIYRLRNNL